LFEVMYTMIAGMIKEDFILSKLGLRFCKHRSRTKAAPKGYKSRLKYQFS